MSYVVHVVQKSDGHGWMVDSLFKETFGHHLLWTDERIRAELQQGDRLVVGGSLIEYPHQWNEALPHLATGTGALTFGILDLQDPVKAKVLEAKLEWMVDHLDYFHAVEGLKMACQLVGMEFPFDFWVDGEGGSWDQLSDDWLQLPFKPKDPVYKLCDAWNVPRLWAAVSLFRQRQDAYAWFLLKHLTLPWSGKTVEASLQQCREALKAAGSHIVGLPVQFELERALRSA